MGLLDNWRAVITWDARGFWHGDLFDGDADEPIDYFTTRTGASRDAAVTMAVRRWPSADISIMGRCGECDDGVDDDGAQCCACDGHGVIEIAAIAAP